MNPFSISGLVITITSLILGIFIFLKSKGSQANKIWAVFCFSVATWGFGSYQVGLSSNAVIALFWWKVAYIGIIFIPVLYYHFVYKFLEIKEKTLFYALYIYGFVFLALLWSPWSDIFFGIKNMTLYFNSLYFVFPPTIPFYFFVFSWFAIIIYSHIGLYRTFKNSFGLRREQIKYFFTATAVGFTGGSTCFLPCFGVNFYPYLNFLVPLYPAIMTYAIVRHRLMDIKLVLRRYSVYLLSLATIITAVIGVKIIINYFQATSVWFDFIILVFALSLFPGLRDYYYRLANKYFFSSLYDSREVISSLSDKLKATLEIERVYRSLSETLTKYFHVKSLGVLTFDENKGEYKVRYNLGFNIGGQKIFKGDRRLHELYIKQGEPIVIEELKNKAYVQFKEILDLFMSLGVEILTPLNIKDKTIGILALGQKESGDMYNEEDLAVLKILSAQTAIAMENALLYEETKKFNIKLKEEINRATTELREANEQLKKLDAAKSDFISIASHQLRTPLTAIKGYISMILEGDFGEVSQVVHDSLHKVFESSERLIHLVEDLLNISRIESGRIQFNFEDIALEKTVASVIEELARNAEKKGIKLEYKKPPGELGLIKADEEKIRQVVINLIDNAIKYTSKGKVQVSLNVDKGFLEFCVADTGMGIKIEDQKNLFQKFSRGTGTSLVHTEGTGLGLYVAREMIEAHHGKIWAESAGEGKGSKFCVKLPIVKESKPQIKK